MTVKAKRAVLANWKSLPSTCGRTILSKENIPATEQPSKKSSSNEATEIFFLGVGNAYHGIMYLLNNRGKPTFSGGQFYPRKVWLWLSWSDNCVDTVHRRTSGIINFIAHESLEPISNQGIYYLPKWYRSVSLPSDSTGRALARRGPWDVSELYLTN